MLLSKTSELAIFSMLILARRREGYLINPREISEGLGESEAYTSKVLRMLARGGLIRSRRGAAGGFELLRDPAEITLLEIVEIGQGTIPGHYCGRSVAGGIGATCGYHQALHDLKESTRAALSRWSLADILRKKLPRKESSGCTMARIRRAKATE